MAGRAPPVCVHRAACPAQLSELPRQDVARRSALYCHAHPVHRRQGAAGIAKEVRRDAGLERRRGDLEARYPDEIVVVLHPGACLAARWGGLVPEDPKGPPDVQDNVDQMLACRQGAPRRVLLLPDEQPPERRVPRRALQVAAVLLV